MESGGTSPPLLAWFGEYPDHVFFQTLLLVGNRVFAGGGFVSA
jgi:hypothetical protein